MGVRRVIPGQLSLVLPGDFGQMVLPEFGLEQEIPGIGIVAENSFEGMSRAEASASVHLDS